MSSRPRRPDRRTAIRRAALLLLGIACLGILTVYLRESDDGPIHSLQLNSASIMSPVRDVANEAVRPVRDSWDWMTGLASARNDVERLEAEVQELRGRVIEDSIREEQLDEWRRLSNFDAAGYIGDYRPLSAAIDGRPLANQYQRGQINVGREQGVEQSSPVVAPQDDGQGALIGIITSVGRTHSEVTFITDTGIAVGATILDSEGPPGLITSTGAGELRLTRLPRDTEVLPNGVVVTAGQLEIGLLSLYPPGIPIGQVAEEVSVDGDTYNPIQVRPLADPREVDNVVVLIPDSATARRRAAG